MCILFSMVNFQMNTFQQQLCRLSMNTGFNAPISEISAILWELQHNRVSISCGKFNLTFSMLAGVSELSLFKFHFVYSRIKYTY